MNFFFPVFETGLKDDYAKNKPERIWYNKILLIIVRFKKKIEEKYLFMKILVQCYNDINDTYK